MTQILLPIVLAVLLALALTYLVSSATSNGTGDVGRWAAISTIWLSIPTMAAGVLLLVLLGSLIYLLATGLHWLPTYTGKAQDYAYRARKFVRRLANQVVRPVLIFEGLRASLRKMLGSR
jgi:predicted PurR-regulated permease PerM